MISGYFMGSGITRYSIERVSTFAIRLLIVEAFICRKPLLTNIAKEDCKGFQSSKFYDVYSKYREHKQGSNIRNQQTAATVFT